MNNVELIASSGLILLVYGIQLLSYRYISRFPPTEMNSLYGYKSARAMKSKAHWELANRYSSQLMVKLANIYLVLSLLILLLVYHTLSFVWYTSITTGMLVLLISFIFILTERKLKEYDHSKNTY